MELEIIKQAVKEAFQEEMKAFYIDRETHYKQHEWLGEMIKYCEQCKSIIMKIILTLLIGAIFGLMWIGFIFKISK
jgi:hypothetical protein